MDILGIAAEVVARLRAGEGEKASRSCPHRDCRAGRGPASALCFAGRGSSMTTRLTMVYWKGEQSWLGKLLEYPEIMTQGETIEELEENLRDAYRLVVLEDVPANFETRHIAVWDEVS